jgi:hypothetical protein
VQTTAATRRRNRDATPQQKAAATRRRNRDAEQRAEAQWYVDAISASPVNLWPPCLSCTPFGPADRWGPVDLEGALQQQIDLVCSMILPPTDEELADRERDGDKVPDRLVDDVALICGGRILAVIRVIAGRPMIHRFDDSIG